MGFSTIGAKIGSYLLPDATLGYIYRWLVGSDSVSLCLHRVSSHRREGNPYQAATIEDYKLDKIIEYALPVHNEKKTLLTLSFDDGYYDALEYCKSRYHKYKGIEWHFFLCPSKSSEKSSFVWDLYEDLKSKNKITKEFTEFVNDFYKLSQEEKKIKLKNLGADPRFLLASADEWLSLTNNMKITLGNHSNNHLSFANLDDDVLETEVELSHKDFESLYGDTEHFAFPFGTPYVNYTKRCVDVLRKKFNYIIWSTASYSYQKSERIKGSVLPRIVIDGTLPWKEILLFIAIRSCLTRLQRRLKPRKTFISSWN